MKLPRFVHKYWALLFGYYWLPCPLCGEMTGGHEFSFEKSGIIPISPFRGKVTCTTCKPMADRYRQ